jgi:hypothetical protein
MKIDETLTSSAVTADTAAARKASTPRG